MEHPKSGRQLAKVPKLGLQLPAPGRDSAECLWGMEHPKPGRQSGEVPELGLEPPAFKLRSGQGLYAECLQEMEH